MLAELSYYVRMARGLRRLLRTAPLADPEAVIQAQMAAREANFLETARRVIFADPTHPYHQMFQLAGCGYEDLAAAVRQDGLERTLTSLQRQGVFLTHAEFKGHAPIVRSGRHIAASPKSFRNPLVEGLLENLSSGSRSKGTATPHSVEFQLNAEAHHALVSREFGLERYAQIVMRPVLPSILGLQYGLRGARQGHRIERWFVLGAPRWTAPHYEAATVGFVLLAWVTGTNIPFPTYLPANDFRPAAQLVARMQRQGIPCVVTGPVSAAVRVAAAARQSGVDIRGTVFLVSGEALTAAKRNVIESAGAEVFPRYTVGEIGTVGHACRQLGASNVVHVFRDAVAVTSRRTQAPLAGTEVNSLLFTTLLSCSPHILINAEMDDCGTIEPAQCQCTLSRAGFTECIRDIWSFGKLTGLGVTLVGTVVVKILEEMLPARFGGAPGDFQLVESEGEHQTHLQLRVSPRVGVSSREAVREFFLQRVQQEYGGTLADRMWRHADALEIVIDEPFVTRTGKILTLHLRGLPTAKRQSS